MNPSTPSLRARAGRTPRLSLLVGALSLLGHAGAASAGWSDSIDFHPPDGSISCTYRTAMGYVRSDGLNAIVVGAFDDPSYTFPIVEFKQHANSGLWQMNNLSVAAGGPDGVNPMVYTRGDGLSAVVYSGLDVSGVDDHHIHELALFNGVWGHTDLSAAASPPGVASWDPSEVWGYTRGDGISAVVYVAAADTHIHELARVAGVWHDADLSVAGGDPAGSGSPDAGGLHAYVQADGSSAVVYVGKDGRLRQFELRGGKWRVNTIGLQAGQAAGGGLPMGYVRADGVSAVVYLGSDLHIHELSLVKSRVKGVGWIDTDLSAAAGISTNFSVPWGFVREDHVSAVMYTDMWASPSHVHQLALVNGHWKDSDLTLATGSPYGGSLITRAFIDSHKQTVVPRCLDSDDIYRADLAVMRDGPLP